MAADEFQTNVISVWVLMSAIFTICPLSLVVNQFHVNISSLLASKPMSQFSIYNSSTFLI